MAYSYLKKWKLLLGGILLLTVACNNLDKQQKKTNILFCIADDASWEHFSAYGCAWVKTPAFDRVANEGVLFSNAYTPNAKCSPSRSVVLTGRNSWQLEEAANHNPYFPKQFKTFPEALKQHGYWTGYIGKGWSPGNAGSVNGVPRQLTGPAFNSVKTTPPTKGISKIDYAENFKNFLKAKPKDAPFYCWFGSKEPHRKYEFKSAINRGGKNLEEITQVPSFWPDNDTVRTDMLDYAFEIEYFDSHLQKMLNYLEEIGELANTLVVVTSDNGMPFPRVKGQVYEYSNHLPLAIMWPDGIKAKGRVVTDMVSFTDFAPTFLELAQLNDSLVGMKSITGKSLMTILKSDKEGQVESHRDFVLVGKERHDVGRPNDQGYPVRGIVKHEFLYLCNYKNDRWPAGNPETGYSNTDGSPTKSYILNHKEQEHALWSLNFGKREAEELYNIKKDPYCMENLAMNKEYEEVKQLLHDELQKRLIEQQDPRVLGKGDIFDVYKYAGNAYNYYNRQFNGEIVKTGWINFKDKQLSME
ncbi:sulfatase family protein [Labilibacter marinus]|uniref:sulfatase family protein n=1 Tax=Labilibacter marinus TaxID=1477105 RepID=UPI00095001EA|nr:sulfatase [Labilibacter marinus]